MALFLDLNADVGEGFPHDRALLELVSSANIACSFHAGDEATMARMCAWCAELGVAVGAQVSYRDRQGFGRRRVEIGYDELLADVAEQLRLLRSAADQAGLGVGYVKPHGALYHRVVRDREQAQAVVDATRAADPDLSVLCLPGSVLLELAAEVGLRATGEFFADRGYLADGSLVDRSSPLALETDPQAVAARVRQLVGSGTVTAIDGTTVFLSARSICVHGDTPDAVALAGAVADVLTELSVEMRCFP